jgi:hypothetical protein
MPTVHEPERRSGSAESGLISSVREGIAARAEGSDALVARGDASDCIERAGLAMAAESSPKLPFPAA